MTEHQDRSALLMGVLTQFHTHQAGKLLGAWTEATEHIKTPQLRMACHELRATWTKTTKPQAGDLNAIANRGPRQSPGSSSTLREFSLPEVQDIARRYLADRRIDINERTVMKATRSIIASARMRLTAAAELEAVESGILMRDQIHQFVPPWTFSSEKRAAAMIGDLAKAGLIWCDETQSFQTVERAVWKTPECDALGLPWPASPTFEAIRQAHEAMQGAPPAGPPPAVFVPDAPAGPTGGYAIEDLF